MLPCLKLHTKYARILVMNHMALYLLRTTQQGVVYYHILKDMVRHTFESDPDKWSLEAIIHKIGGTVEPPKQPAVSNTHFTKNRS